MVMEISYLGKRVFLCEFCGFGYAEEPIAVQCENYCRTHGDASSATIKRAVLRPQSS
jgi:hypothetical protein